MEKNLADLTQEIDYTINRASDPIIIYLTDSGAQKLADAGMLNTEYSLDEDNTRDGTYSLEYRIVKLMHLTDELFQEFKAIMSEGSDYTITGTTIMLTDAGMKKLEDSSEN